MIKKLGLILTGLLLVLATGCEGIIEEEPENAENNRLEESYSEENNHAAETIGLTEPDLESNIPLEKAINQRASRREYQDTAIKKSEVAQLLWSASGKQVDGVSGATRVAPSAGATHPMEMYLAAGKVEGLETGVYRYLIQEHSLEQVSREDIREELAEAALGQNFIAQAPVSVIIVAHHERTTNRYGERGERYVHMEAGNISQNLYLQAETLNLATVAVGAFEDNLVAKLLQEEGEPLLIMPVGEPN